MIDFRELVKNGVHFGHQKTRWNPKMAPYIWGFKNNVHLIDVSKTARQMEKSAKFLEKIASQGKTILWVGTKKAAQDIIGSIADETNSPYVNHRWIGGTLSNYSQVKKSVTKLLHYEDILSKSENFPLYTKKEFGLFQKMVDRLTKNVGGIRKLGNAVGAIVVVDVRKEQSVLREASVMGIPVVALVDTNSDPSMVDYVIPANDDSPRAIKLVLDYLKKSVEKGVKAAKEAVAQKAEEQKAAKEAKAADKVVDKKPAVKKAAPVKKTEPAKKAVAKPVAKKAESAKKPVAKKAAAKSADKKPATPKKK